MSKDFYRQFEDRHRGSRELIMSRLQAYLPFITPLKQAEEAPLAMDLGCGRGEWLELITQAGFSATGVDLDEQMLAACHERSLDVQCQDVMSALKQLPSDSQTLVSGFHLAEHLAFSDLQLLVQEAFRVLKTGGLLILETPNPENIVVGATNFYLDPSHHHPLPPLLLSFLPEFYGFDRVKVLRLQEPLDLLNPRTLTIHDVLGGVSPDYAIIAQKNSRLLTEDALANPFQNEYGVSLSDVSQRYEAQRLNQIEQLHQAVQVQGDLINSLTARISTLEKILSPLLWANRQRRLLKQEGIGRRLGSLVKKIVYWFLLPISCVLRKFPKVRSIVVNLCMQLGIYHWLDRIVKPAALTLSKMASEQDIATVLTSLPPKTQELYKEISSAFDAKSSK